MIDIDFTKRLKEDLSILFKRYKEETGKNIYLIQFYTSRTTTETKLELISTDETLTVKVLIDA